MANRRIELDFIVSDEKVPALQGVLMTFISRAARYVLRKRVRTAVLFIVLTIITASMLSATAVSQAAQHEAGPVSYTHLHVTIENGRSQMIDNQRKDR